MFHSPEFKASLGHKFKDPVHYAISAVRLAYGDKVILNTGPIQGWLNRLAEGLYNHETPDGYLDGRAAAWDGPGQMATRFEIARQIGSGGGGLFKPDQPGAHRPAAASRRCRTPLLSGTARRPRVDDLTLGGRHPGRAGAGRPRRRTGTPCSSPPPNSCAARS